MTAVAIAAPIAAQTPAQRLALRYFRDSLQLAQDTVPLHDLEVRGIATARVDRDNAIVHLRLGFLALRIDDLSGNHRRIDDAESEFQWATELRPGWPYPWFGLGLALARAPNRASGFAGGLWTMLGIDRDARAGQAFARSIRADPSFVDGVAAFAETALDQRLAAPVDAALNALRLVQASPLGWDPNLLLDRGRLERLAGHADSARLAFQRARMLSPDPAMADLELARTLPLTADTLAAEPGQPAPLESAYYAAAESDDPDVVAGCRRDLHPIAPDSTLRRFDAVHGAARVAWLKTFWEERAAPDLRSPAARLAEHFRRWDYAERHFRLPPFHRVYQWGIEVYQSHDPDLDDRGIIWIRHGAPSVRIVWPVSQPRAPPPAPTTIFYIPPPRPGSLLIDPPVGDQPTFGNETWRYRQPDGDLVLHFAANEEPDDYRLIEGVMQLDVGYDALAEREGDLPGLSELLHSGPVTRGILAERDRVSGKQNIARATTTTSWPRRYRITLGGRAEWLAAGVKDSNALVHIIFAVDAAMLRRLPGDHRNGTVPITLRAAFVDRAGNPVATLDTVEVVRQPAASAFLVASRAEIPVPAGAYRMRLNVEANPQVGVVFPLDSLDVPAVRGADLALSSILLGVPGKVLPWVATPGDTIWISPDNIYRRGDTMAVFFQLYGVHRGESYTVQLGLRRQRSFLSRLMGSADESVILREELHFPGPTAEIRRAIALDGVAAGKYQLELVVSGNGSRLVRRRGVIVENSSK
ncbi:MAG TPA: hypothetical protein VGL65_02980 [Gemmatimonadales bacterium]